MVSRFSVEITCNNDSKRTGQVVLNTLHHTQTHIPINADSCESMSVDWSSWKKPCDPRFQPPKHSMFYSLLILGPEASSISIRSLNGQGSFPLLLNSCQLRRKIEEVHIPFYWTTNLDFGGQISHSSPIPGTVGAHFRCHGCRSRHLLRSRYSSTGILV